MKPARNAAFFTRLAQDQAGNTLAIAAASIFALMGAIGGAVDISRSYMAQSRLQQACDAGALAARKSMSGERLTDAQKATGYRYFDFNFPTGSYGVTLTSRTYSQPVNTAGTPQAVVNGTVVATVPTTIMRLFGEDTVDLSIECSSKMDIANADVAMVLDVTLSMDTQMDVSSTSTATETRLSALKKAVKAFYDSLGPGRAGGDLSKGRIRYAFIPYGITVNVAHLLNNNQMVDNWTYQSREARQHTYYGWTLGNIASVNNYGGASGPPDSYSADTAYNTFGTVAGTNTDTYAMQSGASFPKKNTTVLNSTACGALNQYGSADKLVGIQQTEGSWSNNPTYTPTDNNPPVHPNTVQNINASVTRTATVAYGYRYRWFSNGGTTACWLERATKKTGGNPGATYTQTKSGTTTRSISWQTYSGVQFAYGPRSLDVSSLKASGAWNGTITIPGLNRSGSTNTYDNVYLSGSSTSTDLVIGGTAQSVVATWRGCIEERTMDNTITGSTALGAIPSGAFDLDTTILANTGDDNTRWRPWLSRAVYDNQATNPADTDDSDCPAPALKLQEIGNYDTSTISTPYPNLFRNTSASPTSFYYPYSSTLWPGTAPVADRSQNTATMRNYINRIKMTSGTTHDIGFLWGLHLVSGEGMFESENPDRFNGLIVSRHIVFMTDGEMNPGEDRYVFSGFNRHDGRMGPTSTSDAEMKVIENRRLRIACEAARRQGITVWVVAITDNTTQDYSDLRACATTPGNYKSAATSQELIASFTTIAQSIGGLRISQ